MKRKNNQRTLHWRKNQVLRLDTTINTCRLKLWVHADRGQSIEISSGTTSTRGIYVPSPSLEICTDVFIMPKWGVPGPRGGRAPGPVPLVSVTNMVRWSYKPGYWRGAPLQLMILRIKWNFELLQWSWLRSQLSCIQWNYCRDNCGQWGGPGGHGGG